MCVRSCYSSAVPLSVTALSPGSAQTHPSSLTVLDSSYTNNCTPPVSLNASRWLTSRFSRWVGCGRDLSPYLSRFYCVSSTRTNTFHFWNGGGHVSVPAPRSTREGRRKSDSKTIIRSDSNYPQRPPLPPQLQLLPEKLSWSGTCHSSPSFGSLIPHTFPQAGGINKEVKDNMWCFQMCVKAGGDKKKKGRTAGKSSPRVPFN